MTTAKMRSAADALLKRYSRTYAEELGLDLSKNRPMHLFLWLVSAELFSARIGAAQAAEAAAAIKASGLTTADHMAKSTWEERVHILNRNGYARYDEKTAGFLGEVADLCLSRYGGDLRKLREAAGRDPKQERRLLMEFKGIGETGVDIFFREAQGAWDELYPFADARSLKVARALDLGTSAKDLAELAPKTELPRLLNALVRADLDKALDDFRD